MGGVWPSPRPGNCARPPPAPRSPTWRECENSQHMSIGQLRCRSGGVLLTNLTRLLTIDCPTHSPIMVRSRPAANICVLSQCTRLRVSCASCFQTPCTHSCSFAGPWARTLFSRVCVLVSYLIDSARTAGAASWPCIAPRASWPRRAPGASWPHRALRASWPRRHSSCAESESASPRTESELTSSSAECELVAEERQACSYR